MPTTKFGDPVGQTPMKMPQTRILYKRLFFAKSSVSETSVFNNAIEQ